MYIDTNVNYRYIVSILAYFLIAWVKLFLCLFWPVQIILHGFWQLNDLELDLAVGADVRELWPGGGLSVAG